jgi:hypothetical protein
MLEETRDAETRRHDGYDDVNDANEIEGGRGAPWRL